MEELVKPCPFCGSEASLEGEEGWFFILCSSDDCPLGLQLEDLGSLFSSEELDIVLDLWNNRDDTEDSNPFSAAKRLIFY